MKAKCNLSLTQGFRYRFARQQDSVEILHEASSDGGVHAPPAGNYMGNSSTQERPRETIGVGRPTFRTSLRGTCREYCELSLRELSRLEKSRTQQSRTA